MGKLSVALLASFRKTAPGNIYIGKHRKWPKVTELALNNKIKWLKLEEQNMLYLRHPYLTLDQSWGHANELGKAEAFHREQYLLRMSEKTKPDVTLEERYDTLRTT